MSATSDTTGEIPIVQPTPVIAPAPQRSLTTGWVIAIVAVVALVLGVAGGVLSHAMFPAAAGAKGATGAPGKAGAAGPVGPTGSAANVDLSKLGVCVNVTYNYSGVSYVSGVDVSTPTETNGSAESCPNGTFTPVQAAPTPAPTN